MSYEACNRPTESYQLSSNQPVLEARGVVFPTQHSDVEPQLQAVEAHVGERDKPANVWQEESQAACIPRRDIDYAEHLQPRIDVPVSPELAHVAKDIVANMNIALEYKNAQDAMRAAGIPLSSIEPEVRVASFSRAAHAAENVKDLISTRPREVVSTVLVMANHLLSKTGEHFAFNRTDSVVLLSGNKVIWTVAKPDRRE